VDLQKDPKDDALREKIIKLSQQLKPPPEIPEEARQHFVKAVTLQKESKDTKGLDLALSEYRRALLVAPWWPEAYYNFSVAVEQTNHFNDALAALKLYLVSDLNATEAREAKDKIYAIEAKRDLSAQTAAAEAEAARKKEQEEIARRDEAFRRLAGTWVYHANSDLSFYYELTITGQSEFTLKWTRSCSKGGMTQVMPYEEVYRISADGLQVIGTGAGLSNLSDYHCGMPRWTSNVTGKLSGEGDMIQIVKSGPAFNWRSCDYGGNIQETRMNLERER